MWNLREILRFTVIDENKLGGYTVIQNRDQLHELFGGILQRDCC